MFNYYIQLKLITFLRAYNGVIFHLKKIAGLKKLLPDSLYRAYNFGFVMVVSSFIYKFVSSIVTKGLKILALLMCMWWFSVVLGLDLKVNALTLTNVAVLLVCSEWITSLSNYSVTTAEEFEYTKMVGVPTRFYHLSALIIDGGYYVISNTIIIFILETLASLSSASAAEQGINFLDSLGFVTFAYAILLVSNYAGLIWMSKIKKHSSRQVIMIAILIFTYLTMVGILIADMYGAINVNLISLIDWRMMGALPVVVLMIAVLWKTNLFDQLSKLQFSHLELKSTDIEKAVAESYKLKDKDINFDIHKRDFSKYKGISYINRIFFGRVGRKFWKNVIARIVICLVAVIGFNVFCMAPIGKSLLANSSTKELTDFFPFFIFCLGFFMYTGDPFTRFCFINMDVQLLKYSYYRRRENLMTAIGIRFKMLMIYNLPIYAGLMLLFVVMGFWLKAGYATMAYTAILGLVSLLFFGCHFLIIYYLFQPFTENLKIKNPLYVGGSLGMFYVFIYGVVNLPQTPLLFGVICLILSAYVAVGFWAIYRFADKRFKLR